MEKEKLEEARMVDVHAHLDEIEDLSRSLQEAKAAGVMGVVAVEMDIESNKKILKIAEENNGYVYPALGHHPWEMNEKEVEENLSFIQNHIHECVALGKIGLTSCL
jgi:TatD DNase family protein